MEVRKTITLPFTQTCRDYGYIIWKKKNDADIQELFGSRKSVDLSIENTIQKQKRVDWKRRRIGITYSVTRKLDSSISKIIIFYQSENIFVVSFE